MFGMSFFKTGEQAARRETETFNAEIVDALKEFSFIDSLHGLLPEDYEALRKRTEIIQSSYQAPRKVAMLLAYVDRMIFVQSEHGNKDAVERLAGSIDENIVASLVSNPVLSRDDEFLRTIANMAKEKYSSGEFTAFSDALFAARKARLEQIMDNKDIDGKLDGQDNVVLKSDEQK